MGKTKGFRVKSRSILKKGPREHGKLGINRLVNEYKLGDKVVIMIDSSIHKGAPHRRYHGKIGVIKDKRGRAYIVNIRQGNSLKEIIVRPEHLKSHMAV